MRGLTRSRRRGWRTRLILKTSTFRAIDWIWTPCMYAERGNADPIELAKQVQIPDDLFGMIFWGYTRYDPNTDAP